MFSRKYFEKRLLKEYNQYNQNFNQLILTSDLIISTTLS